MVRASAHAAIDALRLLLSDSATLEGGREILLSEKQKSDFQAEADTAIAELKIAATKTEEVPIEPTPVEPAPEVK